MSDQPEWKPDVKDIIRLWNPEALPLYTKRAAAWLGESELTTEIHEAMLRARTPQQEVDEISPNWAAPTSGDWVAMKELKTQLYERRGE